MPKAVIMTKAKSAMKAPMPMPNWFFANSPNCVLSKSNDQPLAPIKNALASKPIKPTRPPPKNQLLCTLPAGIDKPTDAITMPIKPNSSHLRPCTIACTMPLAVSGPPMTCGKTMYQAVS